MALSIDTESNYTYINTLKYSVSCIYFRNESNGFSWEIVGYER